MTRLILISLFSALITTSTLASSPARDHLKQVLPQWGFKNVDVDALRTGQVAHITHLLHSNKSPAQIRGNIGAVLGDSALVIFGIKR